eukprot:3932685-Rhodomonas_salina.3
MEHKLGLLEESVLSPVARPCSRPVTPEEEPNAPSQKERKGFSLFRRKTPEVDTVSSAIAQNMMAMQAKAKGTDCPRRSSNPELVVNPPCCPFALRRWMLTWVPASRRLSGQA